MFSPSLVCEINVCLMQLQDMHKMVGKVTAYEPEGPSGRCLFAVSIA